MDRAEAERWVARCAHWHHRFEIFPGVITPGTYEPAALLARLDWPADLGGWRVLDVGACDGYFSFEAAARGADVTAFDYRAKTDNGFAITEAIRGRALRYVRGNVAEIGRILAGERYDMILFLGVLYHLPDPIRAVWDLRAMCRRVLYLESHGDRRDGDEPMMRYLPGRSLAGDITNFWSPNRACLRAILADAGFIVEFDRLDHDRIVLKAVPSGRDGADYKMSVAYAPVLG